MRITFALRYRNLNEAISRRTETLSSLTATASSGKRLQSPGDDPLQWARAADLRNGLREMERFSESVGFAEGFGSETDGALSRLSDLLVRARDVGQRSISVGTPDSREAQAQEVESILSEALDASNTRYQGRYVFSAASLPGTPPFAVSRATDGSIASVSDYQGVPASGEWALSVRLGSGRTETVNLDGRQVFSSGLPASPDGNLLQGLAALRDAIRSGDGATVTAGLSALDACSERLSAQTSVNGTRLSSLSERAGILETLRVEHLSRLSDIEDADMPEVLTSLQLTRTALESSLTVASMLDDLSLVKYL